MGAEPMRRGQQPMDYTEYQPLNELLNRTAAQAGDRLIWFSAEAAQLRENRLGTVFCRVMETALNAAMTYCEEVTPPGARFLRFRSRTAQGQILVKIEYSAGDRLMPNENDGVSAIRELMEENGGYARQMIGGGTGTIKIAFPEHYQKR